MKIIYALTATVILTVAAITLMPNKHRYNGSLTYGSGQADGYENYSFGDTPKYDGSFDVGYDYTDSEVEYPKK